jgi:hypothetical protein
VARDGSGNTATCTFRVLMRYNSLDLTCPADMNIFSCSNGVVVNYSVLASNGCTAAAACIVPDNGHGTASLPGDCPYSSNDTMAIIDGLPVGDTIRLAPVLASHGCTGGGSCADCAVDDCDPSNGETVQFTSQLALTLDGTGSYAGYHRVLNMANVFSQIQNSARTPGTAIQSFNANYQTLQGQITGDPDFDLLRITAGTGFGMPSPGHTTLTQAGPNWAVDSFFDITYRIDFVGAPGGPFAGRSGSTTAWHHDGCLSRNQRLQRHRGV